MQFPLRQWQDACLKRFQERLNEGQRTFVLEACMGAGKSTVAASIAKYLLERDQDAVDHVLVLVPWKSIQGDREKGMLGTFGKTFGIDARDRFFTYSRRQVQQPVPQLEATITTYQEVCNSNAIDTLKLWKAKKFRFALICDEIHHANEINGTWSPHVAQMKDLADYSIFMSGTFFRGDGDPIGCIETELDPRTKQQTPIKHYRYQYASGVKDDVVRSVSTTYIDATVEMVDPKREKRYDRILSEIQDNELPAAKRQVLDPHGEWMRHTIQKVHESLTLTRMRFPDAACLYVCRPGKGDDYTRDGDEGIEDKHVHLIAQKIKELTGEVPTVVSHHDRDSVGKISCFRKGRDPYLVAVNMVSEGCDIPRLRAVAFCRYTRSQMLFRQIVGRALRIQYDDISGRRLEDGTAAQIFIPTFPILVEFAEAIWNEAQEGIRDRRCKKCGEFPCICICDTCGKKPCQCTRTLFPELTLPYSLDATPKDDGGHMATDRVTEHYRREALSLIQTDPIGGPYSNDVQIGRLLQMYDRNKAIAAQTQPLANPTEERDRMRRKINRSIRKLAVDVYGEEFAKAYYEEIERPFRTKFKVIISTWTVARLREVYERLERRIIEVHRNG